MTQRIQDFFERTLTSVLVSVTPFTASLIPAIFLGVNVTTIMKLHPAFSIVIAIAAEGIGVGSIAIFFKAVQFNKRYSNEKNHVDTRPAIVAYVIYLMAIITTNVLLDWNIQPPFVSLSKALLSLLALSGALMIATNYAINMVEYKNQKKAPVQKTTRSKPNASVVETQTKPIATQPDINLDNFNETQRTIISTLIANPKASNVAIAEKLNITPQAVGKAKRKLIETGVINRNGNRK